MPKKYGIEVSCFALELQDLRKMLDKGKDLGMPDGVLINGKGPYRYNDSLVPAGIEYETFNVHPGNRLFRPLVRLVLPLYYCINP